MTFSKPIQLLAHVEDGTRQIADKPQRRSFTWDYKKEILEQLDAVRGEHSAMPKIMRREGLYPAQVATWRNEALKRARSDFEPSKRGRKSDPTRELNLRISKLEKENAKLQRENQVQRTLIEFQKNLQPTSISKTLPRADPGLPDQGVFSRPTPGGRKGIQVRLFLLTES